MLAVRSRRGRALLAAVGLLFVAGCTARPPGSAATAAPHRPPPGVTEPGCPPSARVVGDHGGAVSSVGFNVEDDLLLSGGSPDNTIRIWDVATCSQSSVRGVLPSVAGGAAGWPLPPFRRSRIGALSSAAR